MLIAIFCLCLAGKRTQPRPIQTPARPVDLDAAVLIHAGHPANRIIPDQTLGAGVDGLERGDIAQVYTPANVARMRSAGLKPISYRLRTELAIEAWHWNRRGTWSDPGRRQGYWTSDSRLGKAIAESYGYRLPRRGSTIDQANDDGYSRLDDGDPSTFWKSNPYLDHRFTHESDSRHPQWVVADLGRRRQVDSIRISWANPYATQYRVEYWAGKDEPYLSDNRVGVWRTFPGGAVSRGMGGEVRLRLSRSPVSARYVRIWMLAGSGAASRGGSDVRDRCGYAIREIYLGQSDSAGGFHDLIRRGRSKAAQTNMIASSTDPWHRAQDRDPHIEQPGFDRLYRSGLSNGLPVMMPAGVLYDTPENGAAMIRYLRSRGYPVSQIEMGEEPDGQFATPEDYGALYLQWADALHRIDPSLILGGPCFQSTDSDINAWPDASGDHSWMHRFLKYLRSRGRTSDLRFFSFEWYPFDTFSQPTEVQLRRAPGLLARFVGVMEREGLPRSIPWFITEYGYSSFVGRPEVEVESALLNAEITAQFLTLGGAGAYLYGYEPNPLSREHGSDNWGSLTMFLSNQEHKIEWPLPTYYGARLLTQEWTEPVHGVHELYPVEIRRSGGGPEPDVTGYAARRPDTQWAVLLLNKSRTFSRGVRVRFAGAMDHRESGFVGPVDLYEYSPNEYAWRADGARGRPVKNKPPRHRVVSETDSASIELPPFSMVVVRGRSPGAELLRNPRHPLPGSG